MRFIVCVSCVSTVLTQASDSEDFDVIDDHYDVRNRSSPLSTQSPPTDDHFRDPQTRIYIQQGIFQLATIEGQPAYSGIG